MVNIKTSNYLKAKNLKKGDVLTIASEGEWITSTRFKYADGNFQKNFVVKVNYGDYEYDLKLNKMNRESLGKAWGFETSSWVGKKVSVDLVKAMVGATMQDSIVLTPVGEAKTEKEVNWAE